jgi:Uma2 family endonuclease
MVQIAEKIISLEDFLKLPETKPASEYIDGKIIEKHNPQAKHSRIQGELVSTINYLTKKSKIAYSFPELRCTFNNRSIVPDIVVLLKEHLPLDENGELLNVVTSPPDWIIEVLSPDQSETKVIKKILFCLKNGCQLGWLIDPEEKSILVFYPHQETDFFDEESEVLPVPEFLPELNLTVGDVFGWLKF